VPDDQHLAIQNSWVLSYRPTQVLTALLAVIDGIGAARDLSWVSMESPQAVPGLTLPARPDGTSDDSQTVAVLTTYRQGRRSARRLADCHPHGTRLQWW